MAELYPYPFEALVRRMFRELEQSERIFDLPARKFFLGDQTKDFSVRFHGQPASSPLGPAAGPQSQLAQNIVLSFLVGGRVMELKTVQILDELEIPRPCIDMQTVGYNVEWSQELKLEQSLEEYVKASMLIEMLIASGKLDLAPGFSNVLYDMSVGYDLAGIQSERVLAFIRGMLDATEIVERLRRQIPDEHAALRELEHRSELSRTLTLSTFHGCPPHEIEQIIDFLLEELRLNCVVKLNPMLLGPKHARELLNEQMGYEQLHIPDSAFERDTQWQQAVDFVGRLGDKASSLGLGFGVKFSNTLIVENHRSFFPASEQEMYLSGPPLHVLAINLVRRFRETFGDAYPISFSAGIDRANFADGVAVGLVPITVCSDLLQPGGYGRASGYFKELAKRMEKVGASDVEHYILRAYGLAAQALELPSLDASDDERARCRAALEQGADLRQAAGEPLFARWVSQTKLLNTAHYAEQATGDARYHAQRNAKPPRKIGSYLELFDCITCDKCIPVCPNDANFTFTIPPTEVALMKLIRNDEGWRETRLGSIKIEQKHQIGNFADFCNECGNCDVFCPEDGGPYVLKPRFFGSLEAWKRFAKHDGFFLERSGATERVYGRFAGQGYIAEFDDSGAARFSGDGFDVELELGDPLGTITGEADGHVDVTYLLLMNELRRAVASQQTVNYVSMLQGS